LCGKEKNAFFTKQFSIAMAGSVRTQEMPFKSVHISTPLELNFQRSYDHLCFGETVSLLAVRFRKALTPPENIQNGERSGW
jgi:hypothetical protein